MTINPSMVRIRGLAVSRSLRRLRPDCTARLPDCKEFLKAETLMAGLCRITTSVVLFQLRFFPLTHSSSRKFAPGCVQFHPHFIVSCCLTLKFQFFTCSETACQIDRYSPGNPLLTGGSQTGSTSNSTSSSSNSGAIVGGIVGAVLGVALILGTVLCFYCRKKRKESPAYQRRSGLGERCCHLLLSLER